LDWKVNNEIRQDRYNQTQYLDHKNRLTLEDGRYSMVLPTVLPLVGHRLGQVRVGKTRLISSLQEKNSKQDSAKFDRAWLDDFITQNDMEEAERIASVPSLKGFTTADEVMATARKIPSWCDAKGKTYKNYRSAIMDWVGKRVGERQEEKARIKAEIKRDPNIMLEEDF
jgi:hypothetical protein